jgi:hypothetical protein
MSQYYINFTYESPCQDFSKNIGLNPNSTVNIRYTLGTMKHLLSENIKLLDNLLENSDHIENIEAIGTNYLGIRFKEGFDNIMIDNEMICVISNGPSESDSSDFSDEDTMETNTDRLNVLQNLFGSESGSFGSESSSDSDIVADSNKEAYLCDKYQELL